MGIKSLISYTLNIHTHTHISNTWVITRKVVATRAGTRTHTHISNIEAITRKVIATRAGWSG